ncbi:MAG TPA: hypothetical protein VFQ53_04670 [Kofleriaceae bacterium]|nr:hypothetical protein [Kofleriaceae bacterium]
MRTVCAYSLWFPRAEAAADIWREIATWIAQWYRSALPHLDMPAGWERGLSERFVPDRDHALECACSRDGDHGPLRELRWRFPDAGDPTLLWTTDAAVLAGEGTWCTLRLRIASADFELLPARVQFRPPRVIRTLLGRGDAHVGVHRVGVRPIAIDPDGVPEMTELMLEQSRRHPFVVVSPEAYTDDVYATDPATLAIALAGLASVYVLTSRWAAFALTEEIGKQYSCYNGAVRIYWPRFDLETDPFGHPLWLPPQIADFAGDDSFARFLLRMLAGAASFRFVEPEAIRAFRGRVENARIAKLRADASTNYDALFDEYARLDAHARELREQRDALAAENEALRAELASRWVPPTDARGENRSVAIDDRPEPTNVREAVEEARRRTSHLIFLDDAIASAHESPYKQPDRVCSALLAIDDVARRWADQLAGGPKLGSRRDAFRQRGFEYKEDISQTAEGKWGDEYTYAYEGRRIVFAPHITIGAKSPDRCLSIHMHWDEAKRKVVIAHVGRHKTNTKS